MKRFFYTLPFILCAAAFLTLSGCRSKTIQYGAQGCYKPGKKEKVVKYSEEVLKTYEVFCFSDHAEMLLNRAIQGGEQETFISMLLYFSPLELKQTMVEKDGFTLLDEQMFGTKKAVYYGFLTQRKDRYIYRLAFTEPDFDHLIVIDYLDTDLKKLRALFENIELIKEKVNCGKG